ncbi:MAG: helix-turn-helix transcriptional regulator [Cyanobacteria bacterium P01_F01_bin.86]
MKPGSKYYPLYQHLVQCQQDTLTLSLAEIEALATGKLPASARTRRAWWSNRSKGALQANAWIEAGYQTEMIDLEKQTITFKRFEAEYKIQHVDGEIAWDRVAIRALRKHMDLTQAKFAESLGVRRQTVSEWENGVYLPDRSTVKHLALVAEKEAFQPPLEPENPTE